MMSWLNAGLLGLLVLGHAVLWIAFINRTHGLPWKNRTLKRLRHVHDAALVLFPLAVIWCVGLHGPRLLLGGSWENLNRFWVTLFVFCTCGCGWLLWMVLQRLVVRDPHLMVETHSDVHDIAADLGHLPVQRGRYFALARVPGNEQFQLELTHKHMKLPTLPDEWDGLSILHLSDFHFLGTITKEYYQRALEISAQEPADLICFTGDLIDNLDLLSWIPEMFGSLSAPLGRYFILGNHDWYQDPHTIRETFAATGWLDLGSNAVEVSYQGRVLGIGGDETPWMGQHPEFASEVDFRLLLSHTPDNIAWARQQRIDLMLSGHNHGGQVRLPLIGPVYSPSLYGCKYSDGTFWEPPTLLHVSRGLAGQHPLRWRCLPEITRLVLHRES